MKKFLLLVVISMNMHIRGLPTLSKSLKSLPFEDIYTISKTLKIKGRSGMDEKELIGEITRILKNEEDVLNMLKILNENALKILDIIRDYDGVLNKKKLLQEFGKSQSTFRKHTQILQNLGFLYYDFENDFFYIPKEILKFVNDFVMEKEEKMEVDDFLYEYLTTDQLRSICKNFEIQSSGRKDTLIERIISSNISEREILGTLSVYDLKWIAEDMGLTKSGKKDDIIKRILDQIKVSKVKEFKVTGEKISVSKRQKIPKKGIDALWENVAEVIDKEFQPLKPVSARLKERQVENDLFQFLTGKFSPDHKIEIEKTKKESRIDLSVDGKIGIELKFNPQDYDRVVGQVERYLSDFNRIILVVCISGTKDNLIKKANAAKQRIEKKGVKVIIKII